MSLLQAAFDLKAKGYGLLIYDGYRPWTITKTFWNITSEANKMFVAPPHKGSKHNRGCAVDITLYSLAEAERREKERDTDKDGEGEGETSQIYVSVVMPSLFDEMTPRAFADYNGDECSPEAIENRELLISHLEKHGFKVNPKEWWHFDHQEWESYPILDWSFDRCRDNSVNF